jgi:transcriptional regulator of acetoin/glycerol metabolism
MTASARRPSTEEHLPPSATEEAPGIPALLGAFPRNVFLSFPKKGETLGRDDVAVAGHLDGKMSGLHVRCSFARGTFWLEDMASRNGTFVNGQRLPPNTPVPLPDGAVVRFATTLFVFRSAHRGGSAPAKPLGKLVGPWGLGTLHAALARLPRGQQTNVLIEGPTGVGKELLAPEIGRAMGRDPKVFGAINVTSFPESIFDAQLFGWERGAFSSAEKRNLGVLRDNEHGSVFLDEIGELSPNLQPKILRLLENREVFPIGATRAVKVDLTIVGATNRSLEEMVERKDFRADLLARFPERIAIPPLEDRPEDLFAILAVLWERRFEQPLDLARTRVDAEAVERMMLHDWPANVRDLERLLTTVDPAAGLKLSTVQAFLGDKGPTSAPLLTKEAIVQVLRSCNNNQSAAAPKLGISRAKLLREMKKHGISGDS